MLHVSITSVVYLRIIGFGGCTALSIGLHKATTFGCILNVLQASLHEESLLA